MKRIIEIILFTFLLTAYAQTNASVSLCDVLAVSDDGSQKGEGDKKKDGKKKDGKKETGDEEEEPDCD